MSDKGLETRERILTAAEPLILKQGFAGTSLDDILSESRLTKGAFFHHFKGKGDLARALIERFVANDLAVFDRFAEEAEKASDDPLEQAYEFLRLFERHVDQLTEPLTGCLLAAYVYESMQFDVGIQRFVSDSFRRWSTLYEKKFEAVLARYTPARPVKARDLADMIVAIIEGCFVLSRSYSEPQIMTRQSRQFRQYLELLFEGAQSARARRRAA